MSAAVLAQWAEQMRPYPPAERQQFARRRLAAIDIEHAKIVRGNGPAIRRLAASGINALEVPIIKGWLGRLAETGEVP